MFLNFSSFLQQLTEPRSKTEDLKRKEFILNVLLVGSIFLFVVANIISAINFIILDIEASKNNSISQIVVLLVLSFFILLYFLSRKGFFSVASYLLFLTLFSFAAYMGYYWGVDVNASLLLYALVIVISGVLISTRFAFLTTLSVGFTIWVVDYLQKTHLIEMNRYWRKESWTQTDTMVTVIIFFVIATVSWLSNREIEKSLMRARRAEADLKKERDSLEITVDQKTKELREIEMDKMAQLYRFAEFGRLSAGLFHDLMNPLNAVSLNMEKVKSREENPSAHPDKGTIDETKAYLNRAISSARKMEDFIVAVRKQISKQANNALFSLTEETRQVISVLSYKALKANIKIIFSSFDNIETIGNAVKFNQVALNLIVNAIDAYLPTSTGEMREVIVSLQEKNGMISFIVEDRGVGISKENIEKIFEPFFTTKNYGMGIGLSMVKRIIEKDFGGTVKVESKENKGTIFIIKFPKIRKNEQFY